MVNVTQDFLDTPTLLAASPAVKPSMYESRRAA